MAGYFPNWKTGRFPNRQEAASQIGKRSSLGVGPGGGRAGEGEAPKQRGLGAAGPEGVARGGPAEKGNLGRPLPVFTGLFIPDRKEAASQIGSFAKIKFKLYKLILKCCLD